MSYKQLSQQAKRQICRWFAEYRTLEEVQALVMDTFGVERSIEGLRHYRETPKWATLTAEYREKYLEQLDEVPISQKRIRLDRLEQLSQHQDPKVRLGALKEARVEMEGVRSTVRLEGISNIDLTSLTDEQVERLAAGEEPATVLQDGASNQG